MYICSQFHGNNGTVFKIPGITYSFTLCLSFMRKCIIMCFQPNMCCYYRSQLPEGSTGEGVILSCSELILRRQVDYRVKVTNTGKTGGGVSALAFISSEVS